YPTRAEAITYLSRDEERYELPVKRPVRVTAVRRAEERLRVETDQGDWLAAAVVSAGGTWEKPYLPHYPGTERFEGIQLHSAHYRSPEPFRGKRALAVGGRSEEHTSELQSRE